MKNLHELVKWARNKDRFRTVNDYANFCREYLSFVNTENVIQATIVAQNEPVYHFYQYKEDGNYSITRPLNSDLLLSESEFDQAEQTVLSALPDIKSIKANHKARMTLNKFVYTCQQAIGATLDALPARKSNIARKINGDLFERFIRRILNDIGVTTDHGFESVPVVLNGEKQFNMKYEHDLIVKNGDNIQAIGSVKTSSKDRIDKIFIDKFLYNKLTDQLDMPHFAVFLNDVQRANTKNQQIQRVSGTFLTGHFKGYTIKLNPLDGVYYCDLRPVMRTDKILRQNIGTLDNLLVTDIWEFVS